MRFSDRFRPPVSLSSLLLRHALLVLLGMLTAVCSALAAEEINCLMCHENLTKAPTVHAAVQMGCPSCHSGIDARDVPHKKTTKFAKGLSADQPELCYGCHDKAKFTKKTAHPALSMGCTGCHNPHGSKHERLLISPPPDVCFNCHDKSAFGKKNVHMPVAGGMCLSCHNPHSTNAMALLNDDPLALCLGCHDQVAKRPHAVSGFGGTGHPIGKREAKDPKRPGKRFYCGSCHNPHSSDSAKLFRYGAKTTMALCTHCHKY